MLNGLFQKIFGSGGSKDVAKKRLQFALVYDKLEVTDDIMQDLQRDMVEVISRYFEIDQNAIKLDIQRSDDLSALVFNTPIIASKHRKPPAKPESIREPVQQPAQKPGQQSNRKRMKSRKR